MLSKSRRQKLADGFTALSHQRRVLIADILARQGKRSLRFDALAAKARVDEGTLRHHLKQMDKAGLITRRYRGPETWISLNHRAIEQLPTHFDIVETPHPAKISPVPHGNVAPSPVPPP